MIARRVEPVRERARELSTRHPHLARLSVVLAAALLIGLTSGLVIARADSGDRVVVGNTGGTLSAVIRVGGAIVVVGGGNARSDLADLVGRSTVPWNRQIDLLIVPGWDDQQPIGALGLIERGDVRQITILGDTSGGPVWTALEGAAARAAIPVNAVNGHSVVSLSSGVHLDLFAGDSTSGSPAEYAVVSLQYRQTELAFVDASRDGANGIDGLDLAIDRAHALVAMRPLTMFPVPSDVLLQPRATTSSDITALGSRYVAEIPQGNHIEIRLTSNQIRLPLDSLTPVAAE